MHPSERLVVQMTGGAIILVGGLLVLAQTANVILAALWFIGSVALVFEQGAEMAYVVGALLTLTLFVAEVIHVCSIKNIPERRYPCVIGIIANVAWIGFGSFIAYSLASEELLVPSESSLKLLSLWMIASNLPLLAFNIVFCISRFHEDLVKFRQEFEAHKAASEG